MNSAPQFLEAQRLGQCCTQPYNSALRCEWRALDTEYYNWFITAASCRNLVGPQALDVDLPRFGLEKEAGVASSNTACSRSAG